MQTAKIAFIIVNFNHSRFLINIIQRFFQQLPPPHEVIIVDDCSNDNSVILIKCLQARFRHIKLVKTETNGGPFKAFMAGVAETDCEYVSCWSCDDEPLPGYIESMERAIRDYPFVDLITCNALVEREGRTYRRMAMPFDSYISPRFLSEIAKKKGIYAINVIGNVVRKEHVEKCWELVKGIKTHFDAMFVYFAAFQKGMIVLGNALVLYRSNMKGFGSSRPASHNIESMHSIKKAAMYFGDVEDYVEDLKVWSDGNVIAATMALKFFPLLPPFIRKIFYKQIYGTSFL